MDTTKQLVDLYNQNTTNFIIYLDHKNSGISQDVLDMFDNFDVDPSDINQLGMKVIKTANSNFN
jgi:hypothetical protein